MKATAQTAALQLLKTIPAPAGALNTAVSGPARHRVVVVYVAPGFWALAPEIPSRFMGFDVVIEHRSSAHAGAC